MLGDGILISSDVHVEDEEVADGDNDKEDNNHDDGDDAGAESQEGSVVVVVVVVDDGDDEFVHTRWSIFCSGSGGKETDVWGRGKNCGSKEETH
jgi:hypothetical protein